MKHPNISPTDRAALEEAARVERAARTAWDRAVRRLTRVIQQASRRGASYRAIATTIGRSHGRVRDLVQRDNS